MTVLAHDFMTKICKKAAQFFHCTVSKVFDRVKSVALWSANIRKLAKDHKGYGSTAKFRFDSYVTVINNKKGLKIPKINCLREYMDNSSTQILH